MKRVFTLLILSLMLFSCKKDASDLCEGVSCKNGGNCVNGDCNCPVQWTGPDCSQQKTPNGLILLSITVTDFPPTDNGAGWDLTSGPDVYVEISLNNQVVFTSNYMTNASAGVVIPANFVLPNVTGAYTIRVYDHDDLDPDDFMGAIQGTLYNSTNGFPNPLNLSCAGCTVGFSVPVAYTW